MVIEFLPDIVGAIVGHKATKDYIGLTAGVLVGEAVRRTIWKDLLKNLGLKR